MFVVADRKRAIESYTLPCPKRSLNVVCESGRLCVHVANVFGLGLLSVANGYVSLE